MALERVWISNIPALRHFYGDNKFVDHTTVISGASGGFAVRLSGSDFVRLIVATLLEVSHSGYCSILERCQTFTDFKGSSPFASAIIKESGPAGKAAGC